MVHETRADASELPPGPRAAQRARRAETTDRIVEAAERIATDEGLEALTMHRLAGELGYRVGALYRYYPSKEALLVAMLARVLGELGRVVSDARETTDGIVSRARKPIDPGEAAILFVVVASRAYLEAARARPVHAAILTRMLADPRPVISDDASAPSLMPAAHALLAAMVSALHDARAHGALSRGDDLERAVLLWSSLQGLSPLRKMERFGIGSLTTEKLGHSLVRALLAGWGADPEVIEGSMERATAAEKGGSR